MIALQVDQLALKWTDYGVMGLVIAGLIFVAWKLFSQQQKYTDGWREEAKEMSSAFVNLSAEQNKIQQRIVDVQEKQSAQTKEFYDSITRKVDDLPGQVIKEINYNEMRKNLPNRTPSDGQNI